MPATYVPSRLDPGQADPFPPWDVPSPPRMSPHESACLGLARSQPWARDKFKGPSGGKCRVLVTNRKQRYHHRHRVNCHNDFLFLGCHALRPHSAVAILSLPLRDRGQATASDRWPAAFLGSSAWKNLLGLRWDHGQLCPCSTTLQKTHLGSWGSRGDPAQHGTGLLEASAGTPEPSERAVMGPSH